MPDKAFLKKDAGATCLKAMLSTSSLYTLLAQSPSKFGAVSACRVRVCCKSSRELRMRFVPPSAAPNPPVTADQASPFTVGYLS